MNMVVLSNIEYRNPLYCTIKEQKMNLERHARIIEIMENKTGYATQELLESLVRGQRKALRHSRFVTVLCLLLAALVIAAALLAIPRVTAVLGRVDEAFSELEGTVEMLDRLDTALSSAENAMGKLDGLADTLSAFERTAGQLDELMGSAEALSDAAAHLGEMDIESLNTGIRNIGQIDFEKLNRAISDLSDVVQTLSQFAGLFG